LQPDDRPYAGWLYVGAVLQRRGWSLGRRLTQEDFAIDAGVIGPWGLGEEAQTWVHEIRAFTLPQGWKHQLKNEPGLQLKYSRAVRLLEWQSDALAIDFTPRTGISLGNFETSLRAGGTVRLGINLPDEFGYHTIDSIGTPSGGLSRTNRVNWSAYVFAAAEGRAVFYDQTLDGSLFHKSHSVDKEWLVGDAFLGFAVAWKHCEVGYAHTFRSPEFRHQTEHDSFGAVFGRWHF
jgi:hypothetical protein